ncbi:MAG TPA: carboxypeptidase-like regulatory domain-containing protein [Acidobacteriaceae bacterium]|nr:carboxypeptidase-like regulatory domain-containing protein [Acidobacteriaceae bacterium]
MATRRRRMVLQLICILLWLLAAVPAFASALNGQVTFNALPVPGATVVVTQGKTTYATITDAQGNYTFPNLTDGSWTVHIAMTGFAAVTQTIVVGPAAPPAPIALKLLPPGAIQAQVESIAPPLPAAPPAAAPAPAPKPKAETAAAPAPDDDELRQRSMDGLLVNGSVNNRASSPFALSPVFGNNRFGQGQYYGSIGAIVSNSALDARPFSITGLNTPRPQFSDVTGMVNFGGPLKIRHMVQKDPRFIVGYQWTRNHEDNTQSTFVPTALERAGDLSRSVNAEGQPITIYDPATGQPFPGDSIPASRISPQAQALLAFYPLPNVATATLYNYQAPLVGDQHQDGVQARLDQSLGFRDQFNGRFALQSTRSSNPNIFGFVDATDLLGINTSVQWSHRFGQRFFLTGSYQFSRLRTRVAPWFAHRENVSARAGISGNDQDPADWGPPALSFSSGVAGLSDQNSADTRTETNAPSLSALWVHGRHNITLGSDFHREEFNYRSQQDPRGSFGFTGAATAAPGGRGSDLADFLLGVPDTSSIAYGNADKYFRESLYDEYVTDDWRLKPELTIDAGVRWEYGAPITELFDRIVNIDVASGFAAVAPVVAANPAGPLTGARYPGSLIEPDRSGIEPRIGIAWRPIGGSSLVVRGGYGIYRDSSVYQGIVTQMAQQAPLSRSLRVENSAACPLTLANGFADCGTTTPQTFGVDPHFRLGYAQNWQLSVQRDLPGSLQLNVTYLGTKGTHGMQEFLPNTYPAGAANPCPGCPVGFTYLISGGNLSREAGRIQLRRRLHSGLAGSLQYTWSKSIDDDSFVGGQGPVSSQSAAPGEFPTTSSSSASANASAAIAQNWRDLAAERGLSSFDQRNTLTAQLQYTSGMGLKGGGLLGGWRGTLLKQWTFLTKIKAGSGLPQTPLVVQAVPGTGVTNTIRPDRTSAPLYAGSGGRFLNRAAYAPPAPGQWGNARRDSIIGPSQFSMNASMARGFRLSDKLTLDARIDATNAINYVNYSAWNTTVTSPQFGLPSAANAMRLLELTFRVRF